MARANRWSMSDRQKVFLAGLMVIGVFLALFGVGLGSAPVAGLGVVLALLGPALVLLSRVRGGKEYVIGTAHVHEVSPPPAAGSFGRAEFQLIVNARGVNGVPVHTRDAAVPTSKWPDVGATLPVMVAVENPRRVNILWNEVLTHRETTHDTAQYPVADQPTPPRPVRQPQSEVYEYSPTPRGGAAADTPTLNDLPPVPAEDPPDPVQPTDLVEPPRRRPSPRPRQPIDEDGASTETERPSQRTPVTAQDTETFSATGPGGGAGLAVLASTRTTADAPAADAPAAEPAGPGPVPHTRLDETTGREPVADPADGLPVRVPAPRPYMSPLERPTDAAAAPPAEPEPARAQSTHPAPAVPNPVFRQPADGERRTSGQTLEFILRESPEDLPRPDAGPVADEVEAPPAPGNAVAHFLAPGPPHNGVPGPNRGAPEPAAPGNESAAGTAPANAAPANAAPTTSPVGATGGVNGVSVTLIVADLQRSRRFYRDILGMEEVTSGAQTSVLAFGDAGVVLRQVPDMKPIDRRLMYLNLEVPDVQQEYERLHAHGIAFVHKPRIVAHGDQLDLCSAMFRDPDGHAVTLMRWEVRR